MDRARFVSSFGAAALALLLIQYVNRFGYTGMQALVLLVAIAVVSVITIGITSFAAGALAFVVYYMLEHALNDALIAAVIVATVAAVATLAAEGKGAWRK